MLYRMYMKNLIKMMNKMYWLQCIDNILDYKNE